MPREELLNKLKAKYQKKPSGLPSNARIILPKKKKSEFTPFSIAGGGMRFRNPDFQALQQQRKDYTKAKRSRSKVEDQLLQTLRLWAENARGVKKVTGLPPGRAGGAVGWTAGKLGLNPNQAPLEGDVRETATSIAKIAAPSAKVGPDLINIFQETLPAGYATFPEARKQIANSLANSMYEEASAGGLPIDVNDARQKAFSIVDEYILNNPDIFQAIAPREYRERFGG